MLAMAAGTAPLTTPSAGACPVFGAYSAASLLGDALLNALEATGERNFILAGANDEDGGGPADKEGEVAAAAGVGEAEGGAKEGTEEEGADGSGEASPSMVNISVMSSDTWLRTSAMTEFRPAMKLVYRRLSSSEVAQQADAAAQDEAAGHVRRRVQLSTTDFRDVMDSLERSKAMLPPSCQSFSGQSIGFLWW